MAHKGTIEVRPSGTFLNPVDLDPELVDIRDIAFASARVPRFSGFTDFVVGEHVLEVQAILDFWGVPALVQLQGLMHDAAECLGLLDFAKPVKRQFPRYKVVEDAALKVIFKALEIPWPNADVAAEIKLADNLSGLLEARRDLPSKAEHPDWKAWVTPEMERHADRLDYIIDGVQLALLDIERTEQVTHKRAVSIAFLGMYAMLREDANV